MFSDAHDYVGQGTATELDRSNGSVTGTATSTQITLDLSGGTTGGYWTFDIAPPAGSTFRTGYYANAQRTPFRSAGPPRPRPLLDRPRGQNPDGGLPGRGAAGQKPPGSPPRPPVGKHP